MTNPGARGYLEDILEALEKIQRYVFGMSLEQFRNDEKTQDSVIRNFEIIGEAVKRISEEFKNSHPEVPWRSAAGMRDTLIHDYPNIVADVVWKTAVEDLPVFKKQIAGLLKENP
jgi:uncharacterized protein with HEPN domain